MTYSLCSAVALLVGFVTLITHPLIARAAPDGSYAQACNVQSFIGSVLMAKAAGPQRRLRHPDLLDEVRAT